MYRRDLKWKIHTILIYSVAGMIILYGLWALNLPIGSTLMQFVNENIWIRAQKVHFPGSLYKKEERPESLEAWILAKTEEMIPLSTFATKTDAGLTVAEDARTYQMILSQQGTVVKEKPISKKEDQAFPRTLRPRRGVCGRAMCGNA